MRKPRGVQIRANRLIGPGKCLVGTIDECPPRGEVVQRPTEAAQEPRGSGPLPSTPARARGSSVRATPSLHPPRILKTISLFYRKEDPEKSRLRGRLQLFFLSLVWGFPIVAAGIPFVVDQREFHPAHHLMCKRNWIALPSLVALYVPNEVGIKILVCSCVQLTRLNAL